jgi:hypothetical protein
MGGMFLKDNYLTSNGLKLFKNNIHKQQDISGQ